ncbi:unnamed protein product [Mytilus coruscus]|uniref:Uncharacterized protein n=1 Tax=Mytilus coruscus TaxID=42192 RepID=A0A6J8CWD7_MYTCO|nr:unnamed protein product [Mytilus coruscus]
MKLSGKEPAWKFSASTDQVTVQLIWNKAKEPEVSSGNSKPALKKKQNKPPSTRRRDAKRYDQWVQAKSSAATSAEVIPHTTKVDKNQQTEAKTALEGCREIVPTKYQGEPEGIVIKTDIVISPFNPRKACHRQYYLQPTSDRGKRCRIDYDEGFDMDDPELLRTPPHTSPLIMPSPEAVITAFTILERPETPYHTPRCKVRAKRSTEAEPNNRGTSAHQLPNGTQPESSATQYQTTVTSYPSTKTPLRWSPVIRPERYYPETPTQSR